MYFNTHLLPTRFPEDSAILLNCFEENDVAGDVRHWVARQAQEEEVNSAVKGPVAVVNILSVILTAIAKAFRTKHKRPMVLMIDSAVRLAEPEFLGLLQDFAKHCADSCDPRIVFMSTDGKVLPFLKNHAKCDWSTYRKQWDID